MNTALSNVAPSYKTVFVHVTALIPSADLDDEDLTVPGVYRVDLNNGVPSDALANAALDGFHSSIGISVLDDFQIVVCDGEDPLSGLLESSEGYENGVLECYVLGVFSI